MTSPALTRPAVTATGTDPRDVRAGALAVLAATVSAAVGVTQVLYPQDTLAEIDPRTRVMLVGLSVGLWAIAAVYLHLAGRARSTWAARLGAGGAVLLTTGMLSSAANGEDLAIFPAIAVVANAAWFIGTIGLAVSLWKAGRVHRAMAGLLVVVPPCTLFLSQAGGGMIAGAYLAVLGGMLLRGRLDRA